MIALFLFKNMDIISSALEQGLTPAIVVVIYLIIVKLIDNKRDNVQTKLNSELVQSITNISNFISDATKNVVTKDKSKCKAAITDSMNHAVYNIIRFYVNTLVNNHIEANKNSILSNIHNLVNAQYYNVYATLQLYEYNGIRVSEYLKKEWMTDIEKMIIESIYNNNFEQEDKILSFSNKINLKFQSYIVYVVNNISEN